MGGLYGAHAIHAETTPSVTREHFRALGVEAQFFRGLHAERLGLRTTLPYEVDSPGTDFHVPDHVVGCWLSHRALWASLLLLPDALFFVIEDDAVFPEGWQPRLERALMDAGDFDLLYVGSCCTAGKPTRHVAGEVYEVHWPFCTHGYVVHRRALLPLIETQDEARCYAPIDVSLTLHSFGKYVPKVFTLLPRLLDQRGTDIPP